MYQTTDQNTPCSWSDCRALATALVYNSTLTEMAYLCGFHKKVAQINLEQHDRIHAPSSGANKSGKPNMPLPQVKPESRPMQNGPKQWEKDAAVKAEAAARPLEGNKQTIGDMPTPRIKKL